MFSRSILLRTVLVLSVLAAMSTVASAAAPSDQFTPSSGTVRTYLTPDLTLKSYFSELAPAANNPKLHGTCRCSCGTAPCARDEDCGGGVGSCSAFIICCAKQPEAQAFQTSPEASRQTEPPVMDFKCK